MYAVPHGGARRRPARRALSSPSMSKLACAAAAREGVQGHARRRPGVRFFRGEVIEVSADRAVHDLRGRRPARRATRHGHGGQAGAARDRAGADVPPRSSPSPAPSGPRRGAPGRGGTTAPGRLLLRLEHGRDRPARHAARGRRDVPLGHQREDHHGVDARRDPRARGRTRGAQPRRLEHALGRGHRAARRRPRARRARAASRWTRRGSRPSRASSTRARCLLCNLFRDQLDRYGELELIADRWAELVAERDGRSELRAERRRPARGRPRARARRVTYFGVEDDSLAMPELQHAADSKHCRRCGHAYIYEAVYLGHLGRYRCPNCGRERPDAAVAAERVRLRGMQGSRSSCARPRAARRSSSRCPGSTTSTTRSRPRRPRLRSASRSSTCEAGLEEMSAVFGRVERIPIEGRDRRRSCS